MTRLPLEHIRAVVLTQAWAGALTTQLLGDMGAEVIQVETLRRSDPWRGGYGRRDLHGTYPNNEPGEHPYNRSALFNAVNRNKLSVTLDLDTKEGKGLFLEMVRLADIVAENFSARVMKNFGLDYPVLRQVNPRIIMLSMPSFGCSGPYSAYAGNGGTTEPMSGMSSLFGYRGGPPMNAGIMHTDAIAGLMGLAALLIALHHRQRTGQGQFIDLSQQETAICFIGEQVMEYTVAGRVPSRCGNRDRWLAPHGNYRCRGEDAWVAIAVRSDEEWARLCAVMGRPEMAADPRFAKAADRRQHADELDQLVEEWTRERDAYTVMELLQREGIPSGPVLKALEVFDNPQLKARGFFEVVHHPEAGTHLLPGMPWKLSRTPGRIRRPAPCLGEHNREVLGGLLGLSPAQIESLIEKGITGSTPPVEEE